MSPGIKAMDETIELFRPGEAELQLIQESGNASFPPRLPEQPIFYPVLNEVFAAQIAREWNSKREPEKAGYVTRFCVRSEFLKTIFGSNSWPIAAPGVASPCERDGRLFRPTDKRASTIKKYRGSN
jgi:hypothetical protein